MDNIDKPLCCIVNPLQCKSMLDPTPGMSQCPNTLDVCATHYTGSMYKVHCNFCATRLEVQMARLYSKFNVPGER